MKENRPKIIEDENSLNTLLKTKKGVRSRCILQISEGAFFVENPQYKNGQPEIKTLMLKYVRDKKDIKPVWIYFPWSNTVVKNVPEEIYYKLRTARNRDIITESEQQNYRDTTVGIMGLSVGSKILSALVQSGGPKKLKIADFDEIEVTNLNRIQSRLTDIGTNKTKVAARETWDLDPYAQIELWEKGLDEKNIEKFMISEPKINFLIDEMDNVHLKILSRFIARKNCIPTIMATDSGDSVILDVERYDLEPNRKIFHGLLGDIDVENIRNLNYKEWLKMATKIIGPEYLPHSMQRSILNIGKTLASVPQLGATASMAGTAVSYVIRKISNKLEMPSGRYVISLDEKISLNYDSIRQKKKRGEQLDDFIKNFEK